MLALQACSTVRLAYNNADEVAYWWIDSYVDFTPTQSQRMREDLARLHRWHRDNELRPVAELLQQAEQLVPGDVDGAQVCAVVDGLRSRLQALVAQAEPSLTTLALDLDTAQLQTLRAKYAKQNAEYRKEWIDVSAEKRTDRRYRQVLERSESVYGRLTPAQRDGVRRQIAQSRFDPRRHLAERQRQQQDVLRMLEGWRTARPSLSEARSQLRGVIARGFDSPDGGYRAYQQELQRESCESFAAAHNTTDATQREAAVKRLRDYRAEIAALSVAPS